MKKLTFFLLCLPIASLSGCAQDDLIRTEGPTLTAGNALATNTALQVIDPWPSGVEDTDLKVPSDRSGDGKAGSDAGGTTPKPVSSTSTGNP